MTERLDGTVVLITGASSGIGEATARTLAENGAAVVVVARRKDRLDQLVEQINGKSGRAIAIEADVTDQAQAQSIVDRTVSEFGRLDTVINNAGVMLLGPAADAPFEEWERMLTLNLHGLFAVTHAALPHLLSAAQDSSRQVADLVNISSVAGRVSRLGSGVYSATKFGVVAFSESLRQEFAKRHLRVSIVEPGAVETELATHLRPEVREQMTKRFADMERLKSEDIADAIHYIVSRPRHIAINEMLIRPTEQEN